ncbi:MAG: hypothetical protein HY714_04770, partial [Candidatus Omnitrophica bacterium]|nr:hypothetical protein [Candidatus Omnitrophota bacterium]
MKTLSFAAFALGTFLLGFFLLFGKGAAVSGSWKYVLRTSDDSFYWASAQASAEIPSSAGNPYYYEERGKKHTIPYPTVSFFGALSAWLGFPVLAFFPLWHVGMPFLVWLTLFLCLHRIWKYPEGPSAALALFFLLSTLYLRDVSHYALLRFSRPGDSLWLLFIWVSGTLNWTASWRHTVWLCLLGAASFWMNPFLAAMGVAVTAIETARSLPSRHWPSLRQHLFSLGAVFAAAVLYFLFIKWNSPGGASSVHVLETDYTLGGPKAEPSSLVLFLLAAALIACRRWFFRDAWTALDRLLLALTGLIAVCGNAGLLVPGNWQLVYHRYNYFAELAYHRYAFMTFEIAVLAGWFHQTLPQFRERPWFQKIEK